MNKRILIFLILAFALMANAQTNKLSGQWLLTKAEVKGKTVTPYQIFNFNENGKRQVFGMEVGTWRYDKKSKSIVLQSKMDKDFNGKGKVIKLTPEAFVMKKGGDIYYYTRVHPEKIANDNKTSHLSGSWKLTGTEYPFAVLKLDLPDHFTLIQSNEGETDTRRGSWLFVPQDNAIIFIGFSHLLRGKMPLSHATADGFTLQASDHVLKAQRIKETGPKMERLTFTEDDFPEDAEPD